MPTALHGEEKLRGHCTFQWEEPLDGGRRSFAVDERHCLACLQALAIGWPSAELAWTGPDALDDEMREGSRRIGAHCTISWEAVPDLTSSGRFMRLFWVEPEHCDACLSILRRICSTEQRSVLGDVALVRRPRPRR